MAIPFFWIALIVCCLYALTRGGAPERIGAVIFIVAVILTGLAVSSMEGQAYRSMEVGLLLVDGAMLVAFLILALKSTRFWPVWMSGLQAVQAAAHLPKLADPELIYWAYGAAQALWSYPMMALLGAATWRHQRRIKQLGADKPWRTSSSRSARLPQATGPTS